jgi:4-amino-4-deoxy-L-arabinose transferase-like glycosyltransferase
VGSATNLLTGSLRKLWWIVLLAFLVRVAVRAYFGAADFWHNGYGFFFELARSISAGKGLALHGGAATAFRVPLYPAFLAAVTFGHKAFVPVLLAQALLGAATVGCAALIARQLFGNAAAVIAAVLTAIYPYYVVHDTALQENVLYTFLTALAVLLLLRGRHNGSPWLAAGAGLVLGADVLTRANLAPFAAVAPLWFLLPPAAGKLPWRRRLQNALIGLGVLAATLSPWLGRSYALTGTPVLSTQSGYFLWLGNNPHTFDGYPARSIDRTQRPARAALSPADQAELDALRGNEAAVDHWFLRQGLDYMRAHPWRSLVGGWRKVAAGFCLLPSPRHGFWLNLIYLLSYGPILLLGLAGLWIGRRDWREHLVFYLLFASFAAVSAVYFAHTSYRSYLDVYLIVFAAGLLQRWLVNGPQPAQV